MWTSLLLLRLGRGGLALCYLVESIETIIWDCLDLLDADTLTFHCVNLLNWSWTWTSFLLKVLVWSRWPCPPLFGQVH